MILPSFPKMAFVLFLAVSDFTSVAMAQVSPHYHPGQTITVSFRFTGANAQRIRSVTGRLIPTTQIVKGQESFKRDYRESAVKTPPDKFQFFFQITDTTGAGTYHLDYIEAETSDTMPLTFRYEPGKDFPDKTFDIVNNQTAEKPRIEDFTVGTNP